jgi:hypothetical protein
MSYVMGQATVPTGTPQPLFSVPSGLCNVTFYNLSAPAVFVGTSTAVTAANGLVCHSIPTNFFTYVGSRGATFYGFTGTATTINYIISTDF